MTRWNCVMDGAQSLLPISSSLFPIPCSLFLEEAELLRAVADQHVLGLLIVIEHHAMGFAAYAGLLVSTEGGVGGIGVVAVDPDASGLDSAAETMNTVYITRPQACAKAVERVVGNFERIGFGFERGDG